MKKRDALKILEKEYDYEENIMEEITNTYLGSLKKIHDLSKKEFNIIEKKLKHIHDDSKRHRDMFKELMEYVKKHGTNKY